MTDFGDDAELRAIGLVFNALEPLDPDARGRVVDYVFKRLGGPSGPPTTKEPARPTAVEKVPVTPAPVSSPGRPHDIRSLKDEKQPKSASEMAAIVAYYLSELAPPEQRKDAVTWREIEKYFKQASYRLPKVSKQTLPNAAAAGYFDQVEKGRYQLNPVGYNLVVHSLPRPDEQVKKRASNKTRTRVSKPKSVSTATKDATKKPSAK